MGRDLLPLHTKKVILHLRDYLRRSDDAIGELDLDKKVGQMVGVPETTVRSIRKLNKRGALDSPPKKRQRPVMDTIDGFTESCIRREILSFYDRGELPTLGGILTKVKENIDFPGGRSTLWKIVKRIGFKFGKVQSGRQILMEREDIVTARCKYLRYIHKNRNSCNPRPEIYIDETWVNQNDSVLKCWTTADESVGPKLKNGKGERFIILHAGGENGFVPGALLMFRAKNGNKGDYHDSMNNECFKTWFIKQLIPNIPENSLIIMDNAPYHSKEIDKVPNSKSKKADVIQWLQNNGIPHDPTHNKLELLELVKSHKGEKKYEIDKTAKNYGHEVLRLPPYHCCLNPIELIWAQIKTEMKKKNSNSNQTIKRVDEITKDAISHVTPQNWRQCMKHTRQIEEQYRAADVAAEHLYERFIITVTDSDQSSDDEHF